MWSDSSLMRLEKLVHCTVKDCVRTVIGAVLHKLSTPSFVGESPPSADPHERFYASPTASALTWNCSKLSPSMKWKSVASLYKNCMVFSSTSATSSESPLR